MTEIASIKHQAEVKNEEELEESMVECYRVFLKRQKELTDDLLEFEENPEKFIKKNRNTFTLGCIK